MSADLHTHSTASDGTLTPEELARACLAAGVTVLAITDHDTDSGAARLAGSVPEGLTFIPGVEVSSICNSTKCHILTLGCDLDHPAFRSLMDSAGKLRRGKLEARIDYLKKRGFHIPEWEYDALRRVPGAGKPLVADLLVKYGYATCREGAIAEILDGCPPVNDRLDAGSVISAIRASGGVSVWAHPMGEEGERELTAPQFDAALRELAEAGIEAVECWYSKYTIPRCLALEDAARRYGLLVSGGSDFHGGRKRVPLGRLNDSGAAVDPRRLTVLGRILPNFAESL